MHQAVAIPMREEVWAKPDLRRMYDEHGGYVRALLCRMLSSGGEADDLTQEVFVIAWQRIDELRPETLRAWLCGVAVRLASAARRKAKVRRFFGLDEAEEVADDISPERAVERKDANRVVYSILNKIAEKKRTVFILHELQGLSGPEIAEAVGCPVNTVWTRLFHARREFLAHLERQCGAQARAERRPS